MKDSKKENITNDATNLQAEALTDLPLADEQAEETKAAGSPYLFLHCASGQH